MRRIRLALVAVLLMAAAPPPSFATVADHLRFGRFVEMDGVVVQALRLDPGNPGCRELLRELK